MNVSSNMPTKSWYETDCKLATVKKIVLAFESLYGGRFTISTQLINQVIYYPAPTQHHSSFRNLAPLVNKAFIISQKNAIFVLDTADNSEWAR